MSHHSTYTEQMLTDLRDSMHLAGLVALHHLKSFISQIPPAHNPLNLKIWKMRFCHIIFNRLKLRPFSQGWCSLKESSDIIFYLLQSNEFDRNWSSVKTVLAVGKLHSSLLSSDPQNCISENPGTNQIRACSWCRYISEDLGGCCDTCWYMIYDK